jgi:hypothetical protein
LSSPILLTPVKFLTIRSFFSINFQIFLNVETGQISTYRASFDKRREVELFFTVFFLKDDFVTRKLNLKKETQQRSPQIAKLHIDWLQLKDDCFTA